MNLNKNYIKGWKLNSCGVGLDPVASFCEHSNSNKWNVVWSTCNSMHRYTHNSTETTSKKGKNLQITIFNYVYD